MTKEQIEELLADSKDFGFSLNIEQYNEGNGILVKTVYQLKNKTEEAASDTKPVNTEATTAEPVIVASPYPPSQYDAILFRKELILPALKAELGRLVEKEKIEKGEWNIAHWFVVWKMFRHYRFITKENTQAMFIRWVTEVFGWGWKSTNFKGTNVHPSMKSVAFCEWTYDNICGQATQADKFIHWKNKLEEAFLTLEKKGKRDCKEQFRTAWFDTKMGR